MKKSIVAVFVVALSLMALPHSIFAGENGFFIGASLGAANVGADLDYTLDREDNFDENDLGYKVYGGLKLGLLGVEGGYVNFGNPDGSNDMGGDVDVKLDGFDLFGVLTLGLGPIDVFGKLGVFLWDSDFSGSTLKDGGDDGFDAAGGIGAAVNFGHFGIRLEVEYFDVGGLMDGATLLSTGIVYTF